MPLLQECQRKNSIQLIKSTLFDLVHISFIDSLTILYYKYMELIL